MLLQSKDFPQQPSQISGCLYDNDSHGNASPICQIQFLHPNFGFMKITAHLWLFQYMPLFPS